MQNRNVRVLVVEDEPLVAMMIEEVLSRGGFSLAGSAANSGQAMKILSQTTPNVAILDLNLGYGQTSLPVAEELERRGIPFIFVTGLNEFAIPQRFRDRPRLSKPIVEEQLQGIVKTTISASRALA